MVDKAHRLAPDVEPAAAWKEVEAIVAFITEALSPFNPDGPVVHDYVDHLAFEVELQAALVDARTIGVIAPLVRLS